MAEADDDTETQTAPAPAPAPSGGLPPDVLTRLIQQLTTQQAAPPTGTPDDGTKPSWTGLLGSVLGGGQAPGYQLRGGQADTSGTRALLNFGINTLLASGPHAVRPDVLSAVATGLQGAQESLGLDQRLAGAQAATAYEQNRQQQQDRLARIKEAIPLLTLQAQQRAAANAANIALGNRPPGTPGTSIAGGSLTPFVATNLPAGVSAAEDQMVRTVIGEAANQGTVGQQAVAAVIKNRMDAGKQGAQDVIFAANQFEPWNNPKTRAGLEAIDPTSKQYQDILNNAVRPVMAGTAKDPTGGATHFYSPTAQKALGRDAPGWAQGQTPTVIGQHNFYKLPYSPQAPAPGQTAAAAPPPPNAALPPAPQPGQIVPPAPVGQNPGAKVPIPPPVVPPVVPPVAPPVQTAGPGAGNAPPGTPTAPVDPAAAPAPAPAIFTPRALTPSEQAATSYSLPPEQEAGFRRAVAEVAGQPDAAAKIAAIEQARTAAIATQREKADAARLAIEATDRRTFQTQQDDAAKFARDELAKQAAEQRAAAQKETEAQAQQQRSIDLERVKSANTIEQQGALVALKGDEKRMDKMGESAAAALPVANGVRQLVPVIKSLPPDSPLSSVIGAYPQLTGALKAANIISPETADNITLFRGLTDHLSTQLRVSGTGSMSDTDLATFKAALPQMVATPAGRLKAAAFLQNLADRVVQEQEFATEYFRRIDPATGKPAHNLVHLNDAINAPRKLDGNGINQGGLGPVVPQAPRFDGPNAYTEAQTWLRNNVQSGHPYMAYLPGNDKPQLLVRE